MSPSNVLVKRKRVLWLVLPAVAAFIAGVWWVRSVQAEGIPTSGALHYTGTLEEEGLPVEGTRDFVVFLWTDPSSDDPGPACTTTATDVPVDDGRFRVDLSDDCVQAVRENPDLWIEVIVDDASLVERGSERFRMQLKQITEYPLDQFRHMSARQFRQDGYCVTGLSFLALSILSYSRPSERPSGLVMVQQPLVCQTLEAAFLLDRMLARRNLMLLAESGEKELTSYLLERCLLTVTV